MTPIMIHASRRKTDLIQAILKWIAESKKEGQFKTRELQQRVPREARKNADQLRMALHTIADCGLIKRGKEKDLWIITSIPLAPNQSLLLSGQLQQQNGSDSQAKNVLEVMNRTHPDTQRNTGSRARIGLREAACWIVSSTAVLLFLYEGCQVTTPAAYMLAGAACARFAYKFGTYWK